MGHGMSDTTDAQLLRRFLQQRLEAAFAELVERHLDLVYSAALRQMAGDVHRAQDVTQAVFCELARKAPALIERPSLAGWLYTTARHIAARTQRGESRRARREVASLAMSDPPPNPAAMDAWESLRPVLDDAMHCLPARDREAVLLRFFENRSYREVGTALGVKENTARMRVERALERLRRQLERRGITSTAVILAGVLGTQTVTGVSLRPCLRRSPPEWPRGL
jgi:RNA polymerase sigma factor (sigma-70 family)